MVAGNMEFVFASRNERSFKPKLKLKLEIIMEKRFLDTCQHKYMLGNQCKNLLEKRDLQSFWKLTAMLVRLVQTISSKYYILL